MLISVIVSTYSSHRMKDMDELIESLNTQTDMGYELIIIVDENQKLRDHIQKN